MQLFASFLRRLSRYSGKRWYPLVLAGLSAADAYVFVVPNEAVLIAAVLPKKEHWKRLAFWTALGSAVGAVSLAALVSAYGESIVRLFSDSVVHSKTWEDSVSLIHRHGPWGLALISLSPLPQHPAVVLVGLAHLPLPWVFLAVFAGRWIKYLLFAWLGAYAPHVLVRWKLLPKEADPVSR